MVEFIRETIEASVNDDNNVKLRWSRPEGCWYEGELSPDDARQLANELNDAADAAEEIESEAGED